MFRAENHKSCWYVLIWKQRKILRTSRILFPSVFCSLSNSNVIPGSPSPLIRTGWYPKYTHWLSCYTTSHFWNKIKKGYARDSTSIKTEPRYEQNYSHNTKKYWAGLYASLHMNYLVTKKNCARDLQLVFSLALASSVTCVGRHPWTFVGQFGVILSPNECPMARLASFALRPMNHALC